MDEALDASLMVKAGDSVQRIRREIDGRYGR
jgi:hypothetical protein